LSYQEIEAILAEVQPNPTGIIYLPYLAGSGAPWPDQTTKGAFIGLEKRHGRGEMLRAILEGTAYEMEAIRQSAEEVANIPINRITAVGGGTQNHTWLQLKADISGCEYLIPPVTEATLLGAALVAGLGCGALDSEDLTTIVAQQGQAANRVIPDMRRHEAYRYWYEKAYIRLQRPLREYYNTLARERSD
jgi:sugar (pentulose or hexulose) kinase